MIKKLKKDIDLLVITINYNSSKLTINSIKSFIENHNNLLYQIIVVDNNSSIEDYGNLSLLEKEFKNINIIRSKENLGFSNGNNLGLKYAYERYNFRYLLLMNNDVMIKTKNLLNNLINDLEKKGKEYVMEMPLINNLKQKKKVEKQVQIRKLPNLKNSIIISSPILKRLFFHITNDFIYKSKMPFKKSVDAYVLSGAFLLIANDFMKKIKFFDSNTFLYSEEYIIGYQMKKYGYKGFLNANYTVDHIQGGSSENKRFSGFLFYHKYKSFLIFLKKYLKAGHIYIFIYKIQKILEALLLDFILNKNIREFIKFIELMGENNEKNNLFK
ncbi:glycosyltransferase family 2 protein [Marinitoga arctica]